jgi:hypothetical protein
MNRRLTTSAMFAGFFCKHCGGRVFEEDPYQDGNGRMIAVLQCVMCSRESSCPWKEYKSLVDKIERVILNKKANKNSKKQILSA